MPNPYNNPPSYKINFLYLLMYIAALGLVIYTFNRSEAGNAAYDKCIAEYKVIQPNAKGLVALGIIKECELLQEDVRGW